MSEKNYSEYIFREILKSGFYDLQADHGKRFMDVQTPTYSSNLPTLCRKRVEGALEEGLIRHKSRKA